LELFIIYFYLGENKLTELARMVVLDGQNEVINIFSQPTNLWNKFTNKL